MAEYEIEPGVFYGKSEHTGNGEYIKYKKGNDELVVTLSERVEIPVYDYEDVTAERHYTDINIQVVKEKESKLSKSADKESKLSKLVDKIRRKDKKEPEAEIIKEGSYRYEVKKEDFIQNPNAIASENQPYVNKLIEKTCKLIAEKGRSTYEMEQKKEADDRRRAQEQEKVNKGIALNKMIADNFNNFLG